MRTVLLTAFIASLLPAMAQAETLKFPSDAPVVSMQIPDDWGPKETETGIDATSADSAIYISVDVAAASTSDKVIDDAISFLSDNGVTIDAATQKESDDVVNGMNMSNLDWDGKDADGPVSVGLSFVSPAPDKLLVITYWGAKKTQEKHGPELASIISSLKPVAQ